MHVRVGTEDDLGNVVNLLADMHATTKLNFPPIDPKKTVDAILKCVREGILLIAQTHDERVVGVLGLQKGSYWFSSHEFIADLVFYVAEDFRASSAGRQLIKAAEAFSDKMKVPLMMSITHGEDPRRKDNLYERTGLKYIGGIFARNL